jgi:nitroimidazol reductase NimA-like FMN-containing flavoprotein (pyridoxamine 5'-phosphate oxidase superfamily)
MVETKNLATLYGAPPMEWADVLSIVDAEFARTAEQDEIDYSISWLTTINADGRPHCTPVGAAWEDGSFWFQTGRTRKARNLARDARCSIAREFREFDLVVEGTARIVTEPEWVARLAKHWADRGWPATPDESGTAITAPYNAQSAGAGPWNVYRIEATSAFAVQKVEPYGATRWNAL